MKKLTERYQKRVSDQDADLRGIEELARSFDAPSFHGSYRKCAEIACAMRHRSLEDLRTCLYFEERRRQMCRGLGIEIGNEDLEYMRRLVRMIRQRSGRHEPEAGKVEDSDCA